MNWKSYKLLNDVNIALILERERKVTEWEGNETNPGSYSHGYRSGYALGMMNAISVVSDIRRQMFQVPHDDKPSGD